ncbi:MAG: DUF1559 domain-containing protein, partial [bacterium]|nr:DUF1559 domain-containing protein [bacterium]
ARAREAARRASCQNNLRQVGLSLKMYTGENQDNFPSIQRYVGDDCTEKNTNQVMFDGKSMYPEYLSEARVLICPSDQDGQAQYDLGRWNRPDGLGGSRAEGSTNPCLLDQVSYFYTGWVFRSEWIADEATNDMSLLFAQDFQDILVYGTAADLDAGWDFTDENGEQHTVHRLREGVERMFIKDINNPSESNLAQTEVPMMFDKVDIDVSEFNHIPGGAEVLFMDGHVEYIRYPGKFPASRAWAELVDHLEF